MSEDLKDKGNTALKEGNFESAVNFYTQAIELSPKNHVLFSNRSAAYAKWSKYEKALEDAETCIQLDSNWSKGYSRKGAALEYLGSYDEAISAYKKASELDPNNEQLKESLASVVRKSKANLFSELTSDPNISKKLKDPNFLRKLKEAQQTGAMDFSDLFGNMSEDEEESPAKSVPKPMPKEEKPPVDNLTEEQKAALVEKDLGNAAYKKKQFEEAHAHYDKAAELDPTNITFLTNKSAVYFEQGEYDKCIELCLNAVEIGRENRADYKLIAKAYSRIGGCYEKKTDLKEAKKYYDKSLSEFRAPDIVKKSQKIERELKELERSAYINPELAEEEKSKGNEAFKKGLFPDAVRYYTEAVRRNPNDPKIYSNRAACYTKLMEFQLALADCEKCIELDPTFLKGYLRKGACKVALKDLNGAKSAYRKALEIDPNCDEARDGLRQCITTDTDPETARKNAMNDPEVVAILQDPAMRMILNQMEDPKALKEHLNNPEIASKIMKLIDAGLISFR